MTLIDHPVVEDHQQQEFERRGALLRLALLVVAAAFASVVTGVTSTVLVVVALMVMIVLHEFGHFITAKAAGMKVTEFFVGFGPRLWSVRRGETEYGVKAILVGGYCRIVGMTNLEQVDPADEPRTYREKPYWRRMSVAVAGSTMHMIIAFVLLWVMLAFVGVIDYDKELPSVGTISRLATGPSPAARAGFRVHDRLVAVDGTPFVSWDEMRPYIRANPGKSITFTVVRAGRTVDLKATPLDLGEVEGGAAAPTVKPGEHAGFVGIGPDFAVDKTPPVAALGHAATGMGRAIRQTVAALGHIFSPSGVSTYAGQLSGRHAPSASDGNRFISPVGFVRVAGQAAHSGLREVLVLLFTINVFVGIFNMVPLLPLDGGHVAIATYERIRSRKGRRYRADMAKMMPLTYAVFLLIVLIGLTSLYLDVVRPLSNPFQ